MLALGQLDLGQEDADDASAEPDPRDTRAAMAAFARKAQRSAPRHVFHVWPEHVPALRLYLDVQTQWREGGLDYAGVEALLRLQGLPRAQRGERFAELQIMERAALKAWAKQRQQRQPRR